MWTTPSGCEGAGHMETSKLLELIARGEGGGLGFKANITSEKSLEQELVAFANSNGGILLIGVGDDGSITGLNSEDIRRINNLLSKALSGNILSSVNENVFCLFEIVRCVKIFPNGHPYRL